jgi:hypothetical protein
MSLPNPSALPEEEAEAGERRNKISKNHKGIVCDIAGDCLPDHIVAFLRESIKKNCGVIKKSKI